MRRALGLVLLVWWSFSTVAAETGPTTYYVQLIRGTNDGQPPVPGCKRVGPKLASQFHAVFRLKHYWEMSRKELKLAPGQAAKVRLNPEREVEIDLSQPGKRKVTVWQGNNVLDRIVRPVGEAMTLTGGNRDGQSIWFIAVRRDRPDD